MKQKKIPMRRCCGCGEQKAKQALIRVVRSADGQVNLDTTGKASGRGAYICNSLECLKKARKSHRIDRTFEITIPDEVWSNMEAEIQND